MFRLNVAVKDVENLTGSIEFSLCLSESKRARVNLVLIGYRFEFVLVIFEFVNHAVVGFI